MEVNGQSQKSANVSQGGSTFRLKLNKFYGGSRARLDILQGNFPTMNRKLFLDFPCLNLVTTPYHVFRAFPYQKDYQYVVTSLKCFENIQNYCY
jgi:hypothetical protein